MAIITIYQGASGSGEELAGALAQALGCRCISREVLVEASLRYGIPEAKLSNIVEREPNWWSRFMENLQPYRIALQAAFCQIAVSEGQENLVYHGHLGHELLPDFKHVLKILLTAPMERRIEQVRARQGLSEAAARKFIDETDKARSHRLMAMFGVDWRDPSRFDLVVNLGRMSINTIKYLILEALRQPDYQMTPGSKQAFEPDYQMTPGSKQAFEDFVLASQVKAVLAMSTDSTRTRLDVKASAGNVAISGSIPSWVSEETLVTKIKNIPGVKDVQTDIVNVPDLGVVDWP